MRGLRPLIGAFLLFAAFGSASATTDEEIFRDFRFNFINPGARSLGLGGAWIAAADDATAIEANPAALHYVSRMEIFAEYRQVEDLSRVTTGASPVGATAPVAGEDFFRFSTLFDAEEKNLVSFVSFAAPFRVGKKRHRARLAFSRQVVLAEENRIATADPVDFRMNTGACTTGSCSTLDYSLVSFPLQVVNGTPPTVERYSINNFVAGTLDADLVHYNLGFSITLGQDFSLGATATLADLDVKSEVTSLTSDPLGLISSVHPRVDVGGVASDIRTATSIDDSDSELTYTLGFLWHPDSIFNGYSPLRLGVVYRQGADLAVTQRTESYNPATMLFEPDPMDPNNGEFENAFKVPDRWGVGFVWEGEHWKYSVDLERILYSDQLDDFRARENFFTSGQIPDLEINELVYTVDDATVPHAGIEYFFTSGGGDWTQAIRVGYYNEADNRIRLQSIDVNESDAALKLQREEFLLDLFAGGEDLDHFTVGFSIGTPSGIEIQFAGDFSDSNDVLVASAIYRFGKRR
jgi:long-subunit fatty acid transport protein